MDVAMVLAYDYYVPASFTTNQFCVLMIHDHDG